MTHFLEAEVLLFSASFQVESDQELHVEHVDSLEQQEYKCIYYDYRNVIL